MEKFKEFIGTVEGVVLTGFLAGSITAYLMVALVTLMKG